MRVVPHVAYVIARESEELKAKIEMLSEEYLEKDKAWREHCAYLDKLMEKRGPPPADLNRRRGAGDAVATEAEYQAILAGLADSAAKDPTHRATKTAATIPDMILTKERDFVYEDENYRVLDPLKTYDFNGDEDPVWTDDERAKFLKRYLTNPKLFGKI
ncbi:hypothetical protein CC85DRAFT_253243, partial [Cutaneotrichosporon oleaginosum]